jgi:hypothetical protein
MHFKKPLAPPVEHVGSQKHWSAFLFLRGFQPPKNKPPPKVVALDCLKT